MPSMNKNGFRRFFLRCLLVLALLFAVKVSLDSALGWILAEVFARGTKCEVSLSNPQIHFFPLTASVDNVMIRHRSEPESAGFRSRHISIRLHFLRLFRKELLLSDLELDGASADSDGTDTGFIQTFAFLFPPKDPNEKPVPLTGLAAWLKGWDFHIPTIRIFTARKPDQLRIRFKGQTYLWDAVDVRFNEQGWDSKKPYDISASGENFRLQPAASAPIALGTLNADGEIGLGRLVIAKGMIESPADAAGKKSVINARGRIILRAPGEYNLTYDAELQGESLRAALSPFLPRPNDAPALLNVSGALHGEFTEPNIVGTAEMKFAPGALIPGRVECGISDLRLSYDVGPGEIRLSNIAVEDLLTDASVTFKLSEKLPLTGSFNLELDQNKRWMQSCLLMDSNEPAPWRTAVSKSIADSKTSANINGTLSPLDLSVQLFSDLSLRDRNIQTQMDSELHFTAQTIDAKFTERGVLPQIQSPSGTTPNDGAKTNFRLALNSNLDIDVHFDRASDLLEIRKFHLLRYPTDRVLARIAPFLPEHTYRALAALPGENSLLDADIEGRAGAAGANSQLKGKAVVSELQPKNIDIDKLTVPIELKDRELSFAGISAELLGGTAKGDLRLQIDSKAVSGKLALNNLHFENDERWRTKLPYMAAALSGNLDISGAVGQLKYGGDLRLETSHPGEPGSMRTSTLKINGDSQLCRIEGALLNNTAQLQLQLPLREEQTTQFQFGLQAANFPLDYFTAPVPVKEGESTEEAMEYAVEQSSGALTGTARYQGPYKDPLSGEGEIRIEHLSFHGAGLSIEDSGTLQASIKAGRLTFTNVKVRAAGRELAIVGGIDQKNGWDAAIQGEWELSSFIPPGEYFEQISGTVDTNLSVKGAASEPIISGPMRLVRGTISFPLGQTIVGVSDVNLDARFSGGNLTIEKLEGRAGGAKITGSGGVTDILSAERRVETQFEFSHLVVEPVEHLTLDLDGALSFQILPQQSPLLSGEITMRSGQYENIVKLQQVIYAITRTITGSAEAATAARHSTSGSNLAFNIHFRAPGGFLLDTNVAQAEVRSDLRLSGTDERPLLEGKIEAVEGTFGIQSQSFDLVSGEANFFPYGNSLDPRISILGETNAFSRTGEEHSIRIAVTGTITRPEVSFSSDSGLRREEIQAMLGIGANIEALDFLRGGRKTKTFAELLNPRSDVSIEERLSGLTKFETVQIDTSLSPTTGEFVPKLVARRPFARRTDLEIQSELTSRQASSADIEYELTPYLSLIAGWRSAPLTQDTERSSGSFGAGIHYRSTFPGFQLFSPRFGKDVWGKKK